MAASDTDRAIHHPQAQQAVAPLRPRGRHQRRHGQPSTGRPTGGCTSSMANLALGLLLASSGASAFFAPAPSHAPCTTAGGGVGPHSAARKARTSTIWGGRDSCRHRCPLPSNVNFVDFAVGRKRRNQRPSGLGMVMGSGEQGREQGIGGVDAGVGRGYGMPKDASVELIRLELAEVPVDRLQKFLRNWAKRRVKVDDPAWQNGVRVGGAKYGVPRTSMPVSDATSNLGVTLSFDGSPTDVINLEVLHLRGGGSCVMVTRGVDGLAKLGGMGPQIASLIRHSEDEIKNKLEGDLTEFAGEYHQRVLKGLAPAAEAYLDGDGEGEEEEGQATILPDGTIDVTPIDRKKKDDKAVAPPWKDGSAPPPVARMGDAVREAEIPLRAPADGQEQAQEQDVPEIGALFDDVDPTKFEKEAFDLFKTMEKGQKGEEKVAGSEGTEGFDEFLSGIRASNGTSETELLSLFEAGKDASRRGGTDQAAIPAQADLAQLEVMIGGDTGLRGGIDIFSGPPQPIGGSVKKGGQEEAGGRAGDGERTKMPGGAEGQQSGTYTMYDEHGDPVLELSADEMASLDEEELTESMVSVDVLIGELLRSPKDIWNSITAEYSDLYLDRYYILAMRARIPKADQEERTAMHAANQAAVNTVQQLADMHQRLEIQQLEKIRDICEAALEDMESLPDKIRYMKPLLDDDFVAYMGYAIMQEREEIVKSGLDPDREPTRWLQVLGVIQKGVMAELQKSVYKDVEAISHVLRLREPEERLALLNITIETLPSMHVRGFKRTATNIVDYYQAQGDDFPDQDLRSMVLEIGQHLEVLMSEERVACLCEEIDEWAAQKAEQDSMESKLRRVREYEAEDLEIRRKSASGLWNRKMRPDARMDTEEKEEIKKLTDAIRGQNLLSGGGPDEVVDADDDDDNDDDGSYTEDDDLRRKLSRLAGPGGALESESRDSPHLFAPGEAFSTKVATARASPQSADLEREAAEGVVDLSEVFSDVEGYRSDKKPRPASAVRKMKRQAEEEEEAAQGAGRGDEWGTFDDDDWLGKGKAGEGEEALRPRGAGAGEDVPGLLGGELFGRTEEAVDGEGKGDEVRDRARSADR